MSKARTSKRPTHWQRVGRRLISLGPRSRTSAAVIAVVVLALLWFTRGDAEAKMQVWPRQQILDAIRFVESSDRDNVPDGDNGLAIGPYQIHRVYWIDATARDRSIGGDYQDCRQRAYAERVIAAYMQRYVPDAWRIGDAETIARVHNGGPKGHQKDATLGYWQRVLARLP